MPVRNNARQTGKGPYFWGDAIWKGAVAVALGDLIYRSNTNYDTPASSFTWAGSAAATRRNFKQQFRGVSFAQRFVAQTADGTNITDGGIICSGEFCFPCTALVNAISPGQWVGPATSGSALLANTVQIVTDVREAIGFVSADGAAGETTITFNLFPATFNGGVQATAS